MVIEKIKKEGKRKQSVMTNECNGKWQRSPTEEELREETDERKDRKTQGGM